MWNLLFLIKGTLTKQMRTRKFLFIAAVSVFLGFLCVPGLSDGYEIFDLGGVRGVYNSAWLGALGAMLPTILLWLPGFYLLRSQISEDKQIKVGQIIAAAPISKLRYLFQKFLCNFTVLLALQAIFTAALMLMQLFRGESLIFSFSAYFQPFLFVIVPYLLVLAAFTIFFDVIPILRGALGNGIIFCFWVCMVTVSVIARKSGFDLFGVGTILEAMTNGARAFFPDIPDGGSFGYYPVSGPVTTFVWSGIQWNPQFLITRLYWVAASVVLVMLSALCFNRFRDENLAKSKKSTRKISFNAKGAPKSGANRRPLKTLSKVQHAKGVNLPRFLLGELKIMVLGRSVWWYLSFAAVIALTPFVTPGEGLKWLSLATLVLMTTWSSMGCKDAMAGTYEFVASSCPAHYKLIANWLAGVCLSLLLSAGMFFRAYLLSDLSFLVPWLIGLIFLPTLALFLGSFSGSTRFFEGLFIALLYAGPINNMWVLDFTGLSSNNSGVYILLTCVLLALSILFQGLKESKLIKYRRF